jgi:hypothetical protein
MDCIEGEVNLFQRRVAFHRVEWERLSSGKLGESPTTEGLEDVDACGKYEKGEPTNKKAQGRNSNHRPPGFHACCALHICARPNMRQDISVVLHPTCAIGWYILGHKPMARRYARWRIHRKSPSWLRPRQEVALRLLSTINL